MKPTLFASSTCLPCLEVMDWINANDVDVDIKWVLPAIDVDTAQRYYRVVSTGVELRWLHGVPTLIDEAQRVEGADDIISHLTNKHNTI